MAHKTFISYKYSEARDLRDRIIEALGDDARYYKGEDGFSDDLSSLKAESIKDHLKQMIHDTTVTIVIISPMMLYSDWIDWEIEYSLREYTRGDKTSYTNGIVGVVMKQYGDYNWIQSNTNHYDGHRSTSYDAKFLFPIINSNRFNQKPKEYYCEECKTVDSLEGCYFAIATEEEFLGNPSRYIENAFDKSQKTWNYDLCKQR